MAVFTSCMDVLALDSAVDITCEHSKFDAVMLSLKTDAAAVGNVEVGVTVWCVCVCFRLRTYVCACLSACSVYSFCLPLLHCMLQLSQLQVATKKVQDRLRELVCCVHTSLATGYQ